MQQILKSTDIWEQKANKVLSHFRYHHADEIDLYDICWRYGIRIKPLDSHYFADTEYYAVIKHLKSYSIPKETGKRGTIYIVPDLSPIEKRYCLQKSSVIYTHTTLHNY